MSESPLQRVAIETAASCRNCGQSIVSEDSLALLNLRTLARDPLCSITCVLEWAWKIRDTQPKPSTSRRDRDPL